MTECRNGDGRLYNPDTVNSTEGIVQVCVAGVWTSVCGMGLDEDEAMAVCGLVGFFNATLGMLRLLPPFICLINPTLYTHMHTLSR